MDDINVFAINEKELENKNLQPKYWDGIWYRKMCHADNGK